MRASHLPRAIGVVIVAIAAVLAPLSVPTAEAAPPPSLQSLSPVNPDVYRSVSYANGGRHFFRVGRTLCQIGPGAAATACRIHPATAPRGVIGVALAAENAGPYWIRSGTSYQLGPKSPFRAPGLRVGQRITVRNVTCGVPRTGVIVCRNNNRSFTVSARSHSFTYPRGDRYHSR